MADFLEEGSESDTDRKLDRASFAKDQFDVFKHEYLDHFDDEGNTKVEGLQLDPKLKKDLINIVRKIQKSEKWISGLN